ncbi:MAG TPA: hypothetical protein VFY13_03435, partial [Luteolibacter sp.]|nr:hypothetical protein [Luteolibacter sp.]
NLEASGIETWPTPAQGALEERLREWIQRCIAIDPAERPLSMVEVAAGMSQTEREVEARNQKQQLLDINRRLKHRSAVLMTVLGVVLAALVIVAVLWSTSEARLSLARSRIVEERQQLTAAAQAAKQGEAQALKEKKDLADLLELERKQHLERLEAARWIGDQLFAWSIETDRQQLPPLEGREMRLTQLERNLQQFISEQEKQPALAKQVALAHLQLAEISISRGRVHEATQRFTLASKQFPALNLDGAMRMRLATDRLLLAQLIEGQSPKEAMASFAEARKSLASLPRGDVDGDRLDQLLAVLDYREARLKMQLGKTEEALSQLMAATQTLNRLLTQRPDTAILRSELAECYLASAIILEDLGKMGDAREVRALAAEKLEGLRKQKPADLKIQSELATCYEAMANAALLAGDLEAATQRCEQALGLLAGVLKERPRDDDAIVLKAGLIALQAGMFLDKGAADRALERYQEAQTLLEQVIERRPDDANARFRLALVWWQKGRVYSYKNDARQEGELLAKARGELEALVAKSDDIATVRPEQIRRSLAYLAGDIGHSRAAAKDPAGARKAFEQSAGLWKQLLAIRPRCEEYMEALEWTQQRLGEIK